MKKVFLLIASCILFGFSAWAQVFELPFNSYSGKTPNYDFQGKNITKLPSDYQAKIGDVIRIHISGKSNYDLSDMWACIVDDRPSVAYWSALTPSANSVIVTAGIPFDFSFDLVVSADAAGVGSDYQKLVLEATSKQATDAAATSVSITFTTFDVTVNPPPPPLTQANVFELPFNAFSAATPNYHYQGKNTTKLPATYQAKIGDVISIHLAGKSNYDITDLWSIVIDDRPSVNYYSPITPTNHPGVMTAGVPFDFSFDLVVSADAAGVGSDYQKLIIEAISKQATDAAATSIAITYTTFDVTIKPATTVTNNTTGDIRISFAASGAASTVGTVKVENLTKGTSLTLGGTDVLVLKSVPTEIDAIASDESIKVIPNPMGNEGEIRFHVPVVGQAKISIIDAGGKPIVQKTENLQLGTYSYLLNGLPSGIFFVNIAGNGYSYNASVVSVGTASQAVSLKQIGSINEPITQPDSKLKSLKSDMVMNYTIGDNLKFTATSGNTNAIETDSPTASKTITFNFVTGMPNFTNTTPSTASSDVFVTNATVTVNTPVTFTVPDSHWCTSNCSFGWDFGNGTYESAGTGAPVKTISHTFTQVGTYTVIMKYDAMYAPSSFYYKQVITVVSGNSTPTDKYETYSTITSSNKTNFFIEDYNYNTNNWYVGTTTDNTFTSTLSNGTYNISYTKPDYITRTNVAQFLDGTKDFEIKASIILNNYTSSSSSSFGIFFNNNSTAGTKEVLFIDQTLGSCNYGTTWINQKTIASAINKGSYNEFVVRKINGKEYFFINQVFVGSTTAPTLPSVCDFGLLTGNCNVSVDYLYVTYLNTSGGTGGGTGGGSAPVASCLVSSTSMTVGSPVTFFDASTGGTPTSWSWSFGDGYTSTTQNTTHTYTSAGTYSIKLTVSNSAGSSSYTGTITVTSSGGSTGSAPVANFTSSNSGLSVSFTNTSSNSPTSYSWSFGDGTTSTNSSPNHTYTTAGTYSVKLTVSNSYGSNYVTKSITVSTSGGSTASNTSITFQGKSYSISPDNILLNSPSNLKCGDKNILSFSLDKNTTITIINVPTSGTSVFTMFYTSSCSYANTFQGQGKPYILITYSNGSSSTVYASKSGSITRSGNTVTFNNCLVYQLSTTYYGGQATHCNDQYPLNFINNASTSLISGTVTIGQTADGVRCPSY